MKSSARKKSINGVVDPSMKLPIRRNFTKYGPGKILFDNRYYRFVRYSKNHILARILSLRNDKTFSQVKVFCVFIGHMKSGGSMLSAMLDAHPDAVFSDEANAMEYVQFGFRKNQLFQMLLRNSKAEAAKGRITARRLGGYSWAVAGQWQGKHETIKVVGDCTTGVTTRSLSLDPNLLQDLHNMMAGVKIKFLHVIRNPFDPIAVSMVRGRRTFENASENYFLSCDLLVELRKMIDAENLLPVRYDEFVKDPRTKLSDVCDFLGLDATEEYLAACSHVIHDTDESRNMVTWNREWIDSVHDRILKYDFLQGYTFEG